jgi:DUF4097 and DUF4098 domain-containing protein YvlB
MAIAALPAIAQQKVDQKRPAANDGVVQVFNVAGSVKVTAWDRGEIAVAGTLGKGVERLEFSGSEGKTLIKVVLPAKTRESADSDLEIQLPAGSQLEVETVSAWIVVQNVTGKVRLISTSGRITTTGKPSRFDVKSVSGNIEISAQGPGRIRTVSGGIELVGAADSVEASSVSGFIHVTGNEISSGDLETTSGSIRLAATLVKNARIDIKSVSGSIDIALPADVAAEFDVTTFSGGISNDFGPAARPSSEYGSGKELSFSTGNSARVVVQTFSGSVHLKKL